MSVNVIEEVLVDDVVVQRLSDGAIKYTTADPGASVRYSRGIEVTKLYEALYAKLGLASIAALATDDTPTHPATDQLTVTATYADGGTKDVTALATYESDDTGVATVDAAGLVTTVGAGSATITATYLGQTSDEVYTVS